jgi:CRISPR-associated protein Cas1
MQDTVTISESSDWASQSAYWLTQSATKLPRKRREREKNPLFLTGHGLSIRVDKDCLLVRDGNTHYPAEQRTWRFFNGSLDIPPALVVIDGSGEITMDAIDWLATQQVSLIRLRWDGEFSAVVTTGGQAASLEKVRWQENTRRDDKARLTFVVNLMREKARNTLITLEQYIPPSPVRDSVLKIVTERVRALNLRKPKSFDELLGKEGYIAAEYFRAWTALPLKWKATGKHPIPDDWREYRSRSALRPGLVRNYRATHPINAMLNYAYGVLTVREQIRLIAEGYDPRIGIAHDRGRIRGAYPAFVLDQMEPLRPVVDRGILQLVQSERFTGADFTIQHDGVCRLNPELARRVAQLTMEYSMSIDNELPGPERS